MSYWKWNQRIQFDDDGYFVNENGETFEGKYQLEDGVPFATRLDGKINWASSMQSHKIGATALYHDVWKKLIGSNDITSTEGGQSFTNTANGYADCRVAVKQKPFFMFVQETAASEPVFYGLYTWGAGKGDKPTFGYDKKVFPDFTVLEGCDNNMPLVMHRVPLDSAIEGNIITDEKIKYNGKDNWELSMGSGKLWEHFKTAFNFVYLLHNDIHPYNGNYSALILDKTISKDKDYWVTATDASANKFDLFRYDEATEQWVKAGIEKATLNLNAQCGNIITDSEVDWDVINQKFINKRVEMFKAGLETHFDKADLMYTMRFNRILGASDNRGKNTYLYKVKASSKIMFLQDDLDTIFLNNNVGKKTKPYYIEEFDKNADGEYYWTSTRNALYNLMELAYPSELRTTTYNILSAMATLGGGTLDGCFQKYFLGVQEYFPVTAYNEISRLLYEDAAIAVKDGRYTPNTLPLPQSLGNLLEAERSWITRRLAYMSSYASYGKFDSGEQAGALSFRSIVTTTGESPTYNFTLQPHTWLYPSIGIGDSAIWSGVRVRAGETFKFPTQKSDGNTNIRILDINSYRYIGEWGDKSVGEGFLLAGTRLTEFVASAIPQEFRPTSMQITALNLTKLDLKGVHTLVGALDLSKLTALEYVDLRGTSLTSITLPTSNTLKKLYLPATLTSLRIDNQPNLEEVVIEGYDQLAEVYVDAKRAGTLNTKTIASNIYTAAKIYDEAHQGELPRQVITTFLNVDWTSFDIKAFMWFTEQKKATLTGVISISEPSVVNQIDYLKKISIIKRWGDVDDSTSETHKGLILSYRKTNWKEGVIQGNFYNDGNYYIPFNIYPTDNIYVNNFSNIQWSISKYPSNEMLNINIDSNGLLYVNIEKLTNVEDSAEVQAVVTLIEDNLKREIVLTKQIKLYNRLVQLGDIIMFDGTFCTPDEYDFKKTAIGICFYLAPRDANGDLLYAGDGAKSDVPEKYKHLRLMIGLSTIKGEGANVTFTGWANAPWQQANQDGLYGKVTNADGTTTNTLLSLRDVNGNTINLNGGFYSPSILGGSGWDFSSPVTAAKIRDEESTEGVLNGGFKVLNKSNIFGYSFTSHSETQEQITARTLDADLAELAGDQYKEGDVVNHGYINMLRVIKHRNTIINNYVYPIEQEDFDMNLAIPSKSSDGLYTELESLVNLIYNVTDIMLNIYGDTYQAWRYKWGSLYFPSFSACYAYEPIVNFGEKLADKFKSHNWFPPTLGFYARLYYYLKLAGDEKNILKGAQDLGLFKISDSYIRHSDKYDDLFSLNNGYFAGAAQNNRPQTSQTVYPICAF